MFPSLSDRKFSVFALVAIAVSVFALYAPSLDNDFTHDDEGQIIANPYVKSLEYLPKAFSSCIWKSYAGGCEGITNYYRPFHNISYILTYAISQSPLFFHLINLVYYILLSFALFSIALKIFKSQFAAIISAAIFVFHPIHTEAAMWIASVPELLYGLFTMLAFWIYLSDYKHKQWATPIVFFAALLSKEPAIFIPAIFLMYDLLFKNVKINLAYFWGYWRYAIFFAGYFLMRALAIGGIGKRADFYDFSFAERIASSIFVFGEYIKKTLWPSELNPFIPFEPISSVSNSQFLANLLIVSAFCALVVWAFIKKRKVLLFGLSIYFIFLSPVIIFINSIAENVVAERYLLAPSLGVALIFGYYANILRKHRIKLIRSAVFFAPAILIGLAMPHIYAQNDVWKSSKALYEYSYALNKSNGDVIDVTSVYDLAVLYEGEGRTEEAKRLYEEVINSGEKKKRIPSMAKAYNNLGKIYFSEGNNERAISFFEKSIEVKPRNVSAYSNIGVTYASLGMRVRAAESFVKAMEIDPNFEGTLNNVRVLFQDMGKLASYNKDGSGGELYEFVRALLKSPVWVNWKYDGKELEALKLVSSSRKENGNVEVTISVNSSYNMTLFPLIFYSLEGELYLRPKFSGSFNQEKGELVLVVPGQTVGEKRGEESLELYIVLEDFRYYKFIIADRQASGQI